MGEKSQYEKHCRAVRISAVEIDHCWYGVALAPDGVVSTATGSTEEQARSRVRHAIPTGASVEVTGPDAAAATTDDAERILAMLAELERGEESHKHFVISDTCVGQPLRNVLYAAAGIPIGYVTTYGNIAKAAGSEARAVGRVMATNPLYPIVPCHRVVGADFKLVGYGGSQGRNALADKLRRISSEARGYDAERQVEVAGTWMTVYPAEWVVAAAAVGDELGDDQSQLSLFE